MSQNSALQLSDLLELDAQQHLFQTVNSQDMALILNCDDLTNGTMDYGNGYLHGELGQATLDLVDDTTTSAEDIKDINLISQTDYTYENIQLRPLSQILSNDEYSGEFDFEVSIIPDNKSKNPWVYSATLNKVYMDMNMFFPVDFKINNRPQHSLYVRITPQYCQHHQASEPVTRCIQHDHPADPSNKNLPEHVRQHVIRCQNRAAQYLGDAQAKERLSIMFPLAVPQVGRDSVTEMISFVCKSSCPAPGMNRRGIEVIFTLEDARSNILGRKCLKVRICACPKRDKEKDEKEALQKGGVCRGKKRKVDHPAPALGKVMAQQDDTKVYNLQLRCVGKQNALDVLNSAEKIYKAKAYEVQGQQPLENLLRSTIAEIQARKRDLQ